ncbi:phytanoyl-CoA dioxygenase family protein [Planktomarina temperata]|nr:phytanoyl-CoA dioxygenase family protein [Planktomarina temperata]
MKHEIKLSGIKQQQHNNTELDAHKEEFSRKGFVVVKNVFDPDQIASLQRAYDGAILDNLNFYKNKNVEMSRKEMGIIRQIYRYNELFIESVVKKEVTDVVDRFIEDDWIITQQNGSHVDKNKNPNGESVGVQVWHRDFVFRHLTTSKPLMINILIPLDKFTKENGATNILPYSHLFPEFPSNEFLTDNLDYAEADLGDMIVLNGLTYHSAGQNLGGMNRRSFNTVFAVPAIRHQVDPFPENPKDDFIKKYEKFLTAGYSNNPSVFEFIRERNA